MENLVIEYILSFKVVANQALDVRYFSNQDQKHALPLSIPNRPKGPRGRPPKSRAMHQPTNITTDKQKTSSKGQKSDIKTQSSVPENETAKKGKTNERSQNPKTHALVEPATANANTEEDVSVQIQDSITRNQISTKKKKSVKYPSTPSRKRKRSLSPLARGNELVIPEYLPSTAAHTQSFVQKLDFLREHIDPKPKRGRGRPPKKIRLNDEPSKASPLRISSKDQYLPSIAAHTRPILGDSGPSLSNPRSQPKRTLRRPMKAIQDDKEPQSSPQVIRSAQIRELTYGQQACLIKRAEQGAFVGVNTTRARAKGQRGRTKNCRLVIFKLSQLSNFSWFTRNPGAERNEMALDVRDDTRTSPNVRTPGRSSLSEEKELQVPFLDIDDPKIAPQPESKASGPHTNHTSPYDSLPEDSQVETDTSKKPNKGHSPSLLVRSSANDEKSLENDKTIPDLDRLDDDVMILESEEVHSPSSNVGPIVPSFTPINRIPTTQLPTRGNGGGNGDKTATKSAPLNKFAVVIESVASGSFPDSLNTVSPERKQTLPNERTNGNPRKTTSLGVRTLTATGGSIGMLRRKIIMDIVEICGGVYSGHRELSAPFITAWMKQNRTGKPDSRTVYAAYRSLINSGKLRELVFSFQTSQGLMVTKSMITLIDVDPEGPKVKEIQKNMIELYPQHFYPKEADVFEEARNPMYFPSKWGTNRVSADLEIDHETEVRLQHKPGFVIRRENQQAAAEIRRQEKEARIKATPPKTLRRKRRDKPDSIARGDLLVSKCIFTCSANACGDVFQAC